MDKWYCITRTKVKGCESKPSHSVLFWFFNGKYPGLHSHSNPGIKLVQVVEFKSHCAVPSVHSSISRNRDEILGVNCFSVTCGFSSFSAFFLEIPHSEVKNTPFLFLCLSKIPRVRVNKIIGLWYVIVLANDYNKQCGYFLLNLIIRENGGLGKTVVGSWPFSNLRGSHAQTIQLNTRIVYIWVGKSFTPLT